MTSPPVAPPHVDPSQQPPPPSNWGWRIAKAAGVAVIIVVVFVLGRDFARNLADDLSPDESASTFVVGEEVEVVIPPGASARSIAAILEERGVVRDGGDFERGVARSGLTAQLKAGTYTLVSGASLDAIVAKLVEGPPPAEVVTIRIVEGLTVEEMLASLAEQTEPTFGEFEAALRSGAVTSAYLPDAQSLPDGVSELAQWEGLLFPDTYEVLADASPASILNLMARTLERRLENVDWIDFEETTGMTPYEGLVIASLIEKEAKLNEDRPLISSVIHNRLAEERALQIDATVIYALGENRGRVLQGDLSVNSPYNTYLVVGLPPTPIGGVRRASLRAAADPADTEFYYYVVVDEDGKHGFSETLDEHNAKVATARAAGILP